MKLRNILAGLAAVFVLMSMTAVGGSAQQTSSSSVTIGGGNFTASLSASNFASLPYSFTEQTARNGGITITVSDQTGDAGGWIITLDVTDFVGNLRPLEVIPAENLIMTGFTITVAADGSQPVSLANMVPMPGVLVTDPDLTWTADPGYGQGSYNLNMTADLIVPGLTTAQTYTSTGTLAIVAGP